MWSFCLSFICTSVFISIPFSALQHSLAVVLHSFLSAGVLLLWRWRQWQFTFFVHSECNRGCLFLWIPFTHQAHNLSRDCIVFHWCSFLCHCYTHSISSELSSSSIISMSVRTSKATLQTSSVFGCSWCSSNSTPSSIH